MDKPLPLPRESPGIVIYLFLCAAAALWVDLGTLHRLQHGDSLLPVLVSLQRWTPFFWEQDRYGMLIPLLARPVTHPFGNLLVQGFLNVSCGLSAFFLLARYMLPRPTYPLVGALGATAFLTLAPAPYRFDYLMDANYGLWLSLGLGGLIVADPAGGARTCCRRLVALGLIVLAHWVYSATAVYLGALVVFRVLFAADFRPRARQFLRDASTSRRDFAEGVARAARSAPGQALLLLLAGFLAGMELARHPVHHPTSLASLAYEEWPHAWARMVEETGKALAPGAWPGALALAAGVAVLSCFVRGRGCASSIPWRDAAALAATALLVALFLGTRNWLKLNVYVPRYLIPSVMLLQAALAMLIVEPLCRGFVAGGRLGLPALIALLLLSGAAWGYGLPSPRRVRADLDRFGALTPDVLAARCTYIAGDYWTVWPAVFHANLTLHERGDSRVVWGVTFRGQPASTLWFDSPQDGRCVCIPVGDPYGDNWLTSFGFSRFQDVERRATVRVLRRGGGPSVGDQLP